MDTITKGRLGYNLFEKEMLLRDWELYVPVLENTKIDCIAIKEGKILKIQIKNIQYDKSGRFLLPVRKISHNQKDYKIHLYNKNEIDFFVGVDLKTLKIYILPINIVEQYSSSIGQTKLKEFENKFDLMEPHIRNNMSGADDIGETLTNYADGNTEGI